MVSTPYPCILSVCPVTKEAITSSLEMDGVETSPLVSTTIYPNIPSFVGLFKFPKLDFPCFNGENPHLWIQKAQCYFQSHPIDEG